MNVYLYLKHFTPEGKNLNEGTSKAVHGLASGLVEGGADVTILCEGVSKDSIYDTKSGYTIAAFASQSTRPSFEVSENLKKYILAASEQSIFVLNGIFHRSVYVLSRFLKKHALSYVAAPHDPYHPTIFRKNSYLKWPYWYLLERKMLQQAEIVQVLDQRHGQWLRQLKVETPTLEVPNGFSPSDVKSVSTLGWTHHKTPEFLFLGRLDAYNKGLDILLKAFAHLTEVPKWNLTLQGPDWGDRQFLEQLVSQLGISESVTFLEPDYELSPSAIIAKYDVFCVASRFEGFSLSALEAMLAGRVLLVSEIAGITPHVHASNCGVIVQPTPDSVKAGVLHLMQQRSHWQEMGLNGRQYALDNLHWNSIASRALEQYQSLLSTKP